MIIVAKLPYPDVPEPDRIPMLLKFQHNLGWVGLTIFTESLVRDAVDTIRGPEVLVPVVKDHPILDDSDRGPLLEHPSAIPSGRLEYYVIRLPLTRGLAGIHERRHLAIECPRLPVGIGLARVGI